jgi:hypothetical protein
MTLRKVLLSKGARVYIATWSAEDPAATIDELKDITGKDSVFFLQLNLADLDSVKAAADEFMRKELELHTLTTISEFRRCALALKVLSEHDAVVSRTRRMIRRRGRDSIPYLERTC